MSQATDPANQTDAQKGLDGLNALLQHRSRLGALVLLSDADAISFTRLRELLKETDGNLGAQLRKLEEANYVEVKKEFQDRKPVTWYSISRSGLTALKNHLKAMQHLIESAKV